MCVLISRRKNSTEPGECRPVDQLWPVGAWPVRRCLLAPCIPGPILSSWVTTFAVEIKKRWELQQQLVSPWSAGCGHKDTEKKKKKAKVSHTGSTLSLLFYQKTPDWFSFHLPCLLSWTLFFWHTQAKAPQLHTQLGCVLFHLKKKKKFFFLPVLHLAFIPALGLLITLPFHHFSPFFFSFVALGAVCTPFDRKASRALLLLRFDDYSTPERALDGSWLFVLATLLGSQHHRKIQSSSFSSQILSLLRWVAETQEEVSLVVERESGQTRCAAVGFATLTSPYRADSLQLRVCFHCRFSFRVCFKTKVKIDSERWLSGVILFC